MFITCCFYTGGVFVLIVARRLQFTPRVKQNLPRFTKEFEIKATLSYGFGQELTVPVHDATMADISRGSIRDAIDALLAEVTNDEAGTAEAIREVVQDPRSVIEMKTESGYQPVLPTTGAGEILDKGVDVAFLVSRPHAGG